jgi:serine/threonine protein phosphatase 1
MNQIPSNFYTLVKTLLKKLFKSKTPAPALIGLPENHRLYCIGDIHGRLDLLSAIHKKIAKNAAQFDGIKTLVYLGDYIDRGEHSKGVIDCLLEDSFTDFKKVFLMGNHEQVLLQFLLINDPATAQDWFKFGGLATLASYGVEIRGIPTLKDLDRLRNEFTEKLPASHNEFFKRLSLHYETEGYFFVHAGIKPKVKLNQQQPEDMLWIREEFLNSTLFHGKVIVHGHTVTATPDIMPNRIGLDTGAYSSGKLTCAVFENTHFSFL